MARAAGCAGVLTVDDVSADPDARGYSLPEAHVGPVADPVALDHVAPLARLVVGIASALPDVLEAYRTGGGVPYPRYGDDFRRGQGAVNRPAFASALVEEWLPALGPATERLATGGRLADLGCGQGWSTIAVARAFPRAEVWGVDKDVASIAEARAAADEHGVSVPSSAPTPPSSPPPAPSTWCCCWRRCTTSPAARSLTPTFSLCR